MMRYSLRFWAILNIAIRRLLAHRLLSLATLTGLIIAVALILTIPIYSESVAFRILTERLIEQDAESNRPPFSYIFSYIGSWNEPVNWEATDSLDTYLREQGGDELGLNITTIVRHFETQNFRLYPSSEVNYGNENTLIDFVSFGSTEDIVNQIEFIEGTYPASADASPDSIVQAVIHENFANEFGMQVGETYLGYNWRLEATNPLQVTTIQITGIWRPIDQDASYWFYRPNVFSDILLVHEATYKNRISPYSEQEINLAIWYLITEGSGINTGRVDELITRHDETEKIADQLLPGTFIQVSPVNELKPYQRIVNVLTLTLTVFSIPIMALLVVFLIMIVRLVVDRQRNETAVLRSRGTSPFQVVGLAAIEGIIMGGIALILGIALATIFTRLMGSTRSFMDFSYDRSGIVSFPPSFAIIAILALLFTIIIRIIPTIMASRHTIISYKLANSRLLSRPIWQRMGIDVLLLIIISFFYYQIVQQGGLIDIEGGNLEEAYDQPFMFLLPPLTIFTLTLLILRLLPLFLRFLAWIIQLTDQVGLLIVTRQLERSPGSYYLPLILLVSTISLGIYTASFARTIDRYLIEQQFYRVAADLSARVLSVDPAAFGGVNTQDSPMAFMHISEFNAIDDIEIATRIGEYNARARLTSGNVDGKFIGIDRADFGQVAFWRADFASVRLGYLLNALAFQPDSALVSRQLMEDRGLVIGDLLQVDVSSGSETVSVPLEIVGVVDYFPRWYPETDGALFVGNLDYVFEQAQTELPHRIIARVTAEFDSVEFSRAIVRRGATGVLLDEPFSRIVREQTRPERQGLFGLLSIGFITSSLATVIGFLLYTIFSYQRRYVELGILRAIGLSQSAMMVSVAWELGLLLLIGLSFGLIIGLAVSVLYIPFMQFISNVEGIMPPYIVTIAWAEITQIVVLFAGTFLVIMVILLVILRRMRIFEAVKLGESV